MKSLIPYIPQLITGGAALLGAFVGGIVVGIVNLWLAIRRERIEKEQAHIREKNEHRNVAIEVKRAARCIDFELIMVITNAQFAIEQKHWSPETFQAQARHTYFATIAPYLSDKAWSDLQVAYSAVVQLECLSAEWQRPSDTQILPLVDIDKVMPLLEAVTTAHISLEQWVGGDLDDQVNMINRILFGSASLKGTS